MIVVLWLMAAVLAANGQAAALNGQATAFSGQTATMRQDGRQKMSPLVRQAMARKAARQATLTAFVRVSDDGTVLRDQGCRSLARFGSIHIVSIPLSQLPSLARERRVLRIEAGQPCTVQMDTTLTLVDALPAHTGLALPQAFTGKGVVVGIQDIGFDFTHPTFYSADMQHYRVKAFWDHLSTDTLQSQLCAGRDYRSEADILACAHSYDGVEMCHGTLTLGIAAGSGYRSPYRGLAWESDICAVANATSNNAHLIDSLSRYKYTDALDMLGFKYIFDYASSVGKPCVISFSEGSRQDLCGDNALLYEVIDSLTGPGRILVASAGNNGRDRNYIHKPVGQASAGTFASSSDQDLYFLMRADKPFDMRTVVYGTEPDTVVYRLRDRWQAVAEGDTLELADTLQLRAGEYVFQLAGYPAYDTPELTAYEVLITAPHRVGGSPRLSLEFLGTDADVEVFGHHSTFRTDALNPALSDGEVGLYTALSPGCAPRAICVGATTYRTSFVNEHGETKSVSYGGNGERAPYSAVGPTYDGRRKPDVMAPGTNVVSALSSYHLEAYPDGYMATQTVSHFPFNGRTYAWAAESGTSLSTPIVAGAVALWLQANPTLTPEQVLHILAQTSRSVTGETEPTPNIYTGYGEIDVYQGLLAAFYGDVDAIPQQLSRHQSATVAFRLHGHDLILTSEEPLDRAADLRIYAASGQLLATATVPAGTTTFSHSLAALPSGVLAVQLHSSNPAVSGSTLIRK